MKLISVQSRGDRLVRVVKTFKRLYIAYGKRHSYHPEWGETNIATTISASTEEVEALKAAEQWLKGASDGRRTA